jgi:hypothetical protein
MMTPGEFRRLASQMEARAQRENDPCVAATWRDLAHTCRMEALREERSKASISAEQSVGDLH